MNSMLAEQNVLGSLIANGSTFVDLLDELREQDFYNQTHRTIFAVLKNLQDKNQPLELFAVADRLAALSELEACGGLGYLTDLAQYSVATKGTFSAMVKSIRTSSVKRQLSAIAAEIAELAETETDAELAIEKASSKLLELQTKQVKAKSLTTSDLIQQTIEEIERRLESDSELIGHSTGFVDLDKKIGGVVGGQLVIIAGRPSIGKSVFAQNIAENLASQGHVLFFSLEMPLIQLGERLIARHGGISLSDLQNPKSIDEDGWHKFTAAAAKTNHLPVHWVAISAMSVGAVMTWARKQHKRTGLAAVVVDYLQLLQASDRHDNKTNEIAEISRKLKQLALELNVPVIALSQLNRGVESRADKRPMMSDLRDSGAIEQDADIVCLMYRDECYNQDTKNKGIAELLVVKNRQGETGMVPLVFQGHFSRLLDCVHGQYSHEPVKTQKREAFHG